MKWKCPRGRRRSIPPDDCLIELRVMNTQTNTVVEDWGIWKDTATDSEKTVINQPCGVEITRRETATITNGAGHRVD